MSLPGSPSLNRNILRRVLAVCVLLLHLCPITMAAVDEATTQWIQVVLDRWREACRTDLRVAEQPLPWMIFYDEAHAWHINPDPKLLPAHEKLPRTLRFSGRVYDLFEVVHESKLWAPGREAIPVTPMAVTMLYAEDTKPFFIMGTPRFQGRALKTAETEDFRNFLIGMALHELAHTRQLPYVVSQIRRLQGRYRYPDSVDDNMIQTAFEGNAEFHSGYKEELKQLSAAVLEGELARARTEAAAGLRMIERRRDRFFVGKYEGWSEMEDIFFALEGSAMWVQFKSALRMAPNGQPWLETLATLGQRTDAWSQSEGLGLFLLIDRFIPGWQGKFFGEDVPSPVKTLRQALASASH